MTTALCVALWLAFTPAPTQTALPPDPSLIRVRVTTDDAGVAEELAARRNSVTHLAAALGANKNTNRASDTESGWKSAAEDIAKQIDKWIAAHRAAILAARRGH